MTTNESHPMRKSRAVPLGLTLLAASAFTACAQSPQYVECRMPAREQVSRIDSVTRCQSNSRGGGYVHHYYGGAWHPYSYGGPYAPGSSVHALPNGAVSGSTVVPRTYSTPKASGTTRGGFGGSFRGGGIGG